MNTNTGEHPERVLGSRLSRSRQGAGFAVAVIGPLLVTVVLLPARESLGLETVLLLFVLVSVIASALGGVLPALAASAIGLGLANFAFTKPYGSLLVASTGEAIDLVIFVAVAVLVGVVTEWGARARAGAERARWSAELLADVGNRASEPDSVERALAQTRVLYGVNAVRLVEDGATVVEAGLAQPGDTPTRVDAGDGLQLELCGPDQVGRDRRLLASLALTTGRLWRTRQLAEQARRAEELARLDELRSSLLAAVGHDLRNPLAALTVAAETLRQDDLELEPGDRAELLRAIEQNVDRLNGIIGNLLDLSRLRAGVLSVQLQPTQVLELLPGILRHADEPIQLDLPDDLPPVRADPGLLERVLANLVDNANRHADGGGSLTIEAERVADRVELRVIDHGPGVPRTRFEEIFTPFQHFGDRSSSGVGLGLAIARGFTDAMGGTLTPSGTEGGGLTMTVSLAVAQ